MEDHDDIPDTGCADGLLYLLNQKREEVLRLEKDYNIRITLGIAKLPEVERIQILSSDGIPEDKKAQLIVNSDWDTSVDLRGATLKSMLEKGPKMTSHTGNNPPYGYLDWWPNSLWMNHQIEPYNDVRVRKAIALSINRDQLDEVVYGGAKISTVYPFPLYPGLAAFANTDAMKAVVQKYNPREFSFCKLRDGEEAIQQLTRGRPDLGFIKRAPAAVLVSTVYSRASREHGSRGLARDAAHQ